MHLNSIKCLINQAYNNFSHFVYDQLGLKLKTTALGEINPLCDNNTKSVDPGCFKFQDTLNLTNRNN